MEKPWYSRSHSKESARCAKKMYKTGFVQVLLVVKDRKRVCTKLLHKMMEKAPVCFETTVTQRFIYHRYELYVQSNARFHLRCINKTNKGWKKNLPCEVLTSVVWWFWALKTVREVKLDFHSGWTQGNLSIPVQIMSDNVRQTLQLQIQVV